MWERIRKRIKQPKATDKFNVIVILIIEFYFLFAALCGVESRKFPSTLFVRIVTNSISILLHGH